MLSSNYSSLFGQGFFFFFFFFGKEFGQGCYVLKKYCEMYIYRERERMERRRGGEGGTSREGEGAVGPGRRGEKCGRGCARHLHRKRGKILAPAADDS